MKITRGLLTAIVTLGMASSGAFAATTVTTFGSLPGATFGGYGIPNNAVTITTFTDGDTKITLGLQAHQRYSNNPAVTNTGLDSNNVGTYYAIAGGDTFSGSNSNPNYARWNIGFYYDGIPSGHTVSLLFDKNPAVGNNPLTSTGLGYLTGNGPENSGNLGMNTPGGFFSFLAPFPGAFNPNTEGEYSFALVVSNTNGEVARSQINVVVNSTGQPPVSQQVPDGGTSLALLGLSLTALAGIKRKLR